MYIPHFLYLGWFYLSAIVSNAAVNMSVQISLKILFSLLLDIYLEVGLLDRMVILYLIFQGAPFIFKAVSETKVYPALS